MNLEERIDSFTALGGILSAGLNGRSERFGEKLTDLIDSQQKTNPWFTPDNVRTAIEAIASELTKQNLTAWTDVYPILKEISYPLKVGVIMAGNIPLVGFHDFLSVLITGNNLIAKTSSKDSDLIELIHEILCSVNKGFRDKVEFTEGTLTNFDMVIATGSNNSSRYFEYYFNKYPHIIRKNRSSIAIIDGNESDAELKDLGSDIFSYFGLGCRNVSKIYIPRGYDISNMIRNWDEFSGIINHNKYANNYDFNKAVYLVNKENFIDTGYLLMKEDSRLSSPVSVVYYEFYDSKSEPEILSGQLRDKIQCIVGNEHIPFGKAQSPHLWDYADGTDTIEFLIKKK